MLKWSSSTFVFSQNCCTGNKFSMLYLLKYLHVFIEVQQISLLRFISYLRKTSNNKKTSEIHGLNTCGPSIDLDLSKTRYELIQARPKYINLAKRVTKIMKKMPKSTIFWFQMYILVMLYRAPKLPDFYSVARFGPGYPKNC